MFAKGPTLSKKEVKMMMDYNSMTQGMMGGNGGLTMLFMWATYLLFLAVLVLGVAALLKYINKK